MVSEEYKEPSQVSPELLESVKNQGSGVLSCFSGSKTSSANAGFLLFSRLQPEDEVTIPGISGSVMIVIVT